MSFWKEIEGNIFALAPMEDVTDTVFREIVLSVSDSNYLNVLFAEFTSTDGLCHPIGKDKVAHRLLIEDSERKLLNDKNVKIVAQIWGSNPENFYKSARMISDDYNFDGIDINMGCPVKKIVKQASCSELIKYPELSKEIILATKEGSNIPVSVKTRTGINKHITAEWLGNIMESHPEAIILHCRTQKMMSDYPAEWEQIEIARDVMEGIDNTVPLIGNGDLLSLDECFEKINKYSIKGVMVGRGIFKNPWFFNKEQVIKSKEEKIDLLRKHLDLFLKTWKNEKNISILKKFFKIYTTDFYGAAEIRAKLMESHTAEELYKVLDTN